MFGQPSYLGVATADWVAALKSSDSLERRLAAHALAEIGRTAREAVPALTEALRDSESFVRVWAAAALARVEPENPDAIPALVAGTRDGIYFVRSLAAWHLGRLGPRHPGIEAAVPELRELLNDNDPSARAEAAVALGNLAGKGAPPAVEVGTGISPHPALIYVLLCAGTVATSVSFQRVRAGSQAPGSMSPSSGGVSWTVFCRSIFLQAHVLLPS